MNYKRVTVAFDLDSPVRVRLTEVGVKLFNDWCAKAYPGDPPQVASEPLETSMSSFMAVFGQISPLDSEQYFVSKPVLGGEDAVYDALHRLVAAKDEKDAHGETAEYRKLKDGAWDDARFAL